MLFTPRSRALLAALTVLFGCRAPVPAPEAPPELIPADLEIARVQARGSVLSGPIAEAAPKAPDEGSVEATEETSSEGLFYELTLIALESSPKDLGLALEALAPRTGVVFDPELPQPLLAAAPGLLTGAGLARGEAARELARGLSANELGLHRVAARSAGRLRPGEVARLGITAVETPEEKDNFLREWPVLGPVTKGIALTLDMHDDGTPSQCAIEWRDIAKPSTDSQREEARLERPDRPGNALSLQRELILLRPGDGPILPDEGPLFVLMGTPFRQAGARSWLARIELRSDDRTAGTEAEQTMASEGLTLRRRDRRTPLELQALTLRRAASQLAQSDGPRAALSYLASGTEALLAQDLSLALKDEEWSPFLEVFEGEREFRLSPDSEPSVEDLAWLLEASAYRFLAKAADEDTLSPSAEAVLLRHAGALGRFPGTIEELLSEYADLSSFNERVVFENQIFLEDSSPSDRVRAHDWLAVRDLAVPNYDPLGSRPERRAALEESERIREEELKALGDGARALEEQL